MWRKLTKLSFDRLGSQRQGDTSQIEIPFLQHQTQVYEPSRYVNQIVKLGDVTNSQNLRPKNGYERLCTYLQLNYPAINPESRWLLWWDLLNILIILYNFIQIPIFIFITDYYSPGYYSNILLFVDIIFILIFIIDLVAVRSRIAFLQKQILVTSYYALYQNYLKTGFIWDLISLFSYIVYVCVPTVIYIKIFFVFKIYTLVKINMEIQNTLFPYIITLSFYKFIKLVFFIFLVTSFGACIYFAVDYYFYLEKGKYYHGGFLWLTGSQTTFDMNLIEEFGWPAWFDYALYWSVQTTAGVGYGNMTPRNSPQVLYCNLMMLTTLCMFSYFTDGILDIITELEQYDLKRQQKMSELNRYIEQNDVKNKSKKRTKFYINSYIRKNYHQIRVSLQQALSYKLTTSLKLVYTLQLTENLPILKTLLYSGQKWTNFAKDIIGYLKVDHLSTGDQISDLFQNNSFKLAVIVKGYAVGFNPILQYQKIYNEWEYFGQRQFFFGGQTIAFVKCKTFTKFYYLQKQDFFKIIKKYTEQNQKFNQLIDGVTINGRETPQFGIQCMLCDKHHHQRFCPINLKWRERIYLKFDKRASQQQVRRHFSRRSLSSDKIRNYKPQEVGEIVQAQDFHNFYVIYNISKQQI